MRVLFYFYPMLEEKRIALTRRANKLIEWLQRPEYAIYVDHDSTAHILKVFDLIIWALERSIPKNDWYDFQTEFKGSRFILDDIFKTQEAEIATYNMAREEVIATLQAYLKFIAEPNIEVVYQD